MYENRRLGIKYLDKRTSEIMLKYIDIHNLRKVGLTCQLTGSRIRQIHVRGLRVIRAAYAKCRKTEVFNADMLLYHMAENSRNTVEELLSYVGNYIAEGIADPENKKYWEQIPTLKSIPTPAELVYFLYENNKEKIEEKIEQIYGRKEN